MKDAKAYQGHEFTLLGKVAPGSGRPSETITSFWNQLQREAENLGIQLHQECSVATQGRYDFIIRLSAPNPESVFRLVAQSNATGKVTTETLSSFPLRQVSEIMSSAWSPAAAGGQSPVER